MAEFRVHLGMSQQYVYTIFAADVRDLYSILRKRLNVPFGRIRRVKSAGKLPQGAFEVRVSWGGRRETILVVPIVKEKP